MLEIVIQKIHFADDIKTDLEEVNIFFNFYILIFFHMLTFIINYSISQT